MASPNFISLLILLLFITGVSTTSTNNRKTLHIETNLHDSIDSPTTTTTTPITNPANFPPYTPTPTIVTIPASNPTPLTPLTPLNPTPTTPTTTIPATTNPTPPVSNPASSYPTTPATQTPITSGQTWCVAQAGAPESSLQSALDYACGIGGADCSTIQQGATCYNPNTLENHASYAFNSYFQNNPVATSCNFGGAATIVNTNPSSGSCVYPSSATGAGAGAGAGTGTAAPASTVPPATTSSTDGASGSPYGGGVNGSPYEVPATGGYGSPPSFMNSSYPASGFPTNYGPDSPPTGNSYPAASTSMQPCISFIVLVAFLSTAKLILY